MGRQEYVVHNTYDTLVRTSRHEMKRGVEEHIVFVAKSMKKDLPGKVQLPSHRGSFRTECVLLGYPSGEYLRRAA
jgi:hypothetical protein